jgi:hypothetical protein
VIIVATPSRKDSSDIKSPESVIETSKRGLPAQSDKKQDRIIRLTNSFNLNY